jgi:hypothetical protein
MPALIDRCSGTAARVRIGLPPIRVPWPPPAPFAPTVADTLGITAATIAAPV